MEELRSTEILDKEIESDARKKAEKILKNADAECGRILSDVENRVKEAASQKAEFYKSKIEQFRKNVEAAVPLEKERFLVDFYAKSVSAALNDYLRSIGAERRLSLIGKSLEKKLTVVSGKKIHAFVFGIGRDSASALLEKSGVSLSSVADISFGESGEEPVLGNEIHEGIILESEDKSVRVRLTIDQIVRELLDSRSMELATTLFGGALPE